MKNEKLVYKTDIEISKQGINILFKDIALYYGESNDLEEAVNFGLHEEENNDFKGYYIKSKNIRNGQIKGLYEKRNIDTYDLSVFEYDILFKIESLAIELGLIKED
ncbi:hypothetical protein [Brassicibacter mesophilus]|uniref:hypothetical protein n=1 Tax=Brassicibacter mesophilus TaxID=745119 RepID=UPI003D1DF4A4